MKADEIIYCNKEEFEKIEKSIPPEQRFVEKWFADRGISNIRTFWSSLYILKDE